MIALHLDVAYSLHAHTHAHMTPILHHRLTHSTSTLSYPLSPFNFNGVDKSRLRVHLRMHLKRTSFQFGAVITRYHWVFLNAQETWGSQPTSSFHVLDCTSGTVCTVHAARKNADPIFKYQKINQQKNHFDVRPRLRSFAI